MNIALHPNNWPHYKLLMRLDKPIGSLLLLWPCYSALWLAAEGMPSILHCVVFGAGVVVMRSAGCVINDYADRKVDGHVERTKNRPLVSGDVTPIEALQLFVSLGLIALFLVLWLNWQTVLLSIIAVLLATCYPFVKRFSHLPQLVLGAAFGWSIPMAYMAVIEDLPVVVWWLYLANLCWTMAYDTMYAMVDRNDDMKIGVKSTAILFGRWDKRMIFVLQLATLFVWYYVGILLQLSWIYFSCLLVVAVLFVYQQWLIRLRHREDCFRAFLHNNYVGMVLFFGIVAHYLSLVL